MAVMTSHPPNVHAQDTISAPSSAPVHGNRRSLKTLLSNSGSHAQPLPTRPRTNSMSTRPSPRFHVANPTESTRPLPAPSTGSDITRLHINTTGLHDSSISTPSTSSSISLTPKHMSKVSLPIGPSRTTPVSPVRRPLPAPPKPIPCPRPRSSSRGPPRSRTNSAAGRADLNARPQLAFDPTSSSYVIKTSREINGHISAPPIPASDKTRLPSHHRSRSAQLRNFSSLVLPDVRDIRETPSWKGKQAVRSAPCSDTEDTTPPRTRPPLVLRNPTEPSLARPPVPSHPPVRTVTSELTSPLLLPPTGSIKDMLPPLTTSKATLDPLRRTPPPATASSRGVLSPSQPTNLDIGFAEPGYIDDSRVYVDDGYDGPGGLGAFSTLVDPDVDLDIGEIRFNNRPPSGQYMGPSASINVMLDLDDDMDMDTRGRHGSRPSQSLRWKSADFHRVTAAATVDSGADLRRRASGKDTTSSRNPSTRSRTPYNSSQTTVIMSSLKAHMRPLPLPLTPHSPSSPLPPSPSVELGPIPINMDLEPDMVFSKNPAPFTPSSAVPGVLDLMDFDTSFAPLRSTRSSDWVSQTPSREKSRYPVSGSGSQFVPLRPKGFYEE